MMTKAKTKTTIMIKKMMMIKTMIILIITVSGGQSAGYQKVKKN